MTTLAQAVGQVQARGAGRRDAQAMVLVAAGRSPDERTWLVLHGEDPLDAPTRARLDALMARLDSGEPVAYLTGSQGFYGLTLQVTPDVLIPRPDTEVLVDWALQVIGNEAGRRVADLGTGSGAIALAIAAHRPHAQVLGIDRSEAALAVARANGRRLGLPVRWHRSDWLDAVDGTFDLIVSNPPYVAEGDAHLPALRHEPATALVAGRDGLADIRHIVPASRLHLRDGGWLLLEHGHDQAHAVRALMQAAGYCAVTTRTDLAGMERCTGGQWRPTR